MTTSEFTERSISLQDAINEATKELSLLTWIQNNLLMELEKLI